MKRRLRKSGIELGTFLDQRVKGALALLLVLFAISLAGMWMGVGRLVQSMKTAGVHALRVSHRPDSVEAFVDILERLGKSSTN